MPRDADAATPVVLVHGFVVSSRYVAPSGRRLGRSFRVLAPDLPGFGRSGAPRSMLNVSELADALVEWMHVNRLSPVAMVASSFGCQVATDVAMRHPATIERLVLASPTVDPGQRGTIAQIVGWLRELSRQPWSMRRVEIADYAAAGVRRVLATARFLRCDRIEFRLPYIAAPTMVVRGSRDPLVSQGWAEYATRLLPDGRLRTLPGLDHALVYTAPLELARVVVPFLARADGPPEQLQRR